MGSATLIFTEKYFANKDILVEVKIWQLPPSDWKRYPERIKYKLICLNIKTGKKLLMDNHAPKGHHVHFHNIKKKYDFESVDKLFQDFQKFVVTFMEVKI